MCPKRRGGGSAAACTAGTTSCCTGRWPLANGWIPGHKSPACGRLGRAPGSSSTSNRSIPMEGSPSSSGGRWCCLVWTGCPISDRCPPITTCPTLRGTTRSEVSGDWSAHHFDTDVARAAGFDFVFAHGLCTMAICAHRLLGLIGVDDPGRVSRVAVRFASPTPLGCDLTVTGYGVSERSFAFEASADGVTTITHGRLELRS